MNRHMSCSPGNEQKNARTWILIVQEERDVWERSGRRKRRGRRERGGRKKIRGRRKRRGRRKSGRRRKRNGISPKANQKCVLSYLVCVWRDQPPKSEKGRGRRRINQTRQNEYSRKNHVLQHQEMHTPL